jgi:hypothetical protein
MNEGQAKLRPAALARARPWRQDISPDNSTIRFKSNYRAVTCKSNGKAQETLYG